MPTVSVSINHRDYPLACDPGQEELLVALSQEVDDRVRALAHSLPQAGEAMLLLLTALTLADELSDERQRVRAPSPAPAAPHLAGIEASMAETLLDVAGRIERIAQRIENS